MNYVRFQVGNGPAYFGSLEGERVRRLTGCPFEDCQSTFEEYDYRNVRILAPLIPGKIVGVGANYKSFLDGAGKEYPSRPRIFLKPSTSVIGGGEEIRCTDETHRIHFEGELAVVIGKPCRCVPEQEALSYVFGYTCINDVTDRTMMVEDGIWARGKGQDTFAPMGPCIVTGEVDGGKLMLETRVNGEVRQHMSTSDMLFSVPELISFISRGMTLLPGDVIATGTPVGAGAMSVGDIVEVEIEQIGVLKNRFVGADAGRFGMAGGSGMEQFRGDGFSERRGSL